MKKFEHGRGAPALLVALFLVLGAIYSVVTPIFEAGDEVWHYPFVQYLARTGQLPVQDPAHKGLWEQEGGQPPLYYALAAAATFWIDTRDLTDRLWRNPYAHIGIPLHTGNKNLVVHTSAENFPWRDTTLAVHLIRFLSLLFSAGTVALTYLIARESLTRRASSRSDERDSTAARGELKRFSPLLNERSGEGSGVRYLPLLAGGLVAFNPMFLFISASVNNDSLAAALAALALLLDIQFVRRGLSTRRLFILGIVLGLAALTKVSELGLIPLSALVLLWVMWRGKQAPREFLRAVLLLLGPPLVIAGWWYARNFALYGDPLGLNVWLQIVGTRTTPVTLVDLLGEFQGFRISFWGNFGAVNLIAPEWVYTFLDLVSVVALVGLVAGALRRALPATLWIPALWLAVVFVGLVRWTLLNVASQGRLIFPAISAVGVLLAFGLTAWVYLLGSRWRLAGTWAARAVALFLLAFAVAAPWVIIAPAYAQPARLASEDAVPNPVHITFLVGDARPELVGYETGRAVKPGDELALTLYWRTPTRIDEDLYVYIHLYDASGQPLGQWDALPGNGLAPTRLWQPNEIIVDPYHVPISTEAHGQQVGRVEVGLVRVGSTDPLIARDPSGQEIVPTLARFKIIAPNPPTVKRAALLKFEDQLELLDLHYSSVLDSETAELDPQHPERTELVRGARLRAAYTLRALTTPRNDYTVFVHLVNARGENVAQYDGQPRNGTYPTSFWDAGEVVADQFELTLPDNIAPGDYRLEFGLYRAPDGPRLAISGGDLGELHATGDHLLLAPVRVR